MAVLVRMLPTLKAKLSEIAKREHRSLSQQVELFLEHCVKDPKGEDIEENASWGGQSNRDALGANKKRIT